MQEESTNYSSLQSPPLGDGGWVLVTGGTGFLGAYIIKNLVEKGRRVRAIRRSARAPFFISDEVLNKVEWVEGDVLDVVSLADAMKDVDFVVHSAAIVSFSKGAKKQMDSVNVEGTTNVVNIALECGVRRLLHVSSVAAVGRTKNEAVVTEKKSWEPNSSNTHYAVTKHQAEMQVWRGFAEGLSGVIINPSTILGYGDWSQSSCALFHKAYEGFPWYTTGMNGFVGVEDVAEAAVQLLFSNITEKRFIVNAENRSFQSVFTAMAEGFGKKPPHLHATKTLSGIAWRVEALKSLFTGVQPLITKETAKVAQSRTSFSNAALLQALPHFTFTPLDEVIKDACGKYQQAIRSGQLTF